MKEKEEGRRLPDFDQAVARVEAFDQTGEKRHEPLQELST
jgi:hypothetical protein